jgi:hypothetical protein
MGELRVLRDADWGGGTKNGVRLAIGEVFTQIPAYRQASFIPIKGIGTQRTRSEPIKTTGPPFRMIIN